MGQSISTLLPPAMATPRETDQYDEEQSSAEIKHQPKSFLDLPAEMRNQVYELALVSNTATVFELINGKLLRKRDILTTDTLIRIAFVPRDELGLSPALLRVSRQVHLEATPILYGANKFVLVNRYEKAERSTTAEAWLNQIGENFIHLRTVTMEQKYWFANTEAKKSFVLCAMGLASVPDLDLEMWLPSMRSGMGHNSRRTAEEEKDKCACFRTGLIESLQLLPLPRTRSDGGKYKMPIVRLRALKSQDRAYIRDPDYLVTSEEGQQTIQMRRLPALAPRRQSL